MDIINPLIGGLLQLGDPWLWVYVLLGTVIGTGGGAIPGLGTTLIYGLVLPFTFTMDTVYAIAFLMAISVGTGYGNSIPAILMGVPGSSAAILTVLDGHAMHKRGDSGLALGISLFAAMLGQGLSIIIFVLMVVPLTQLAYYFLQPEQFSLYLLGIVAIAGLTGKSVLKGLLAAAIGLIIGIIGLDPVTPTPRFEFGFSILRSGIDVAPSVIGFLALSELFRSARQSFNWGTGVERPVRPKFPWSRIREIIPAVLGGTVIGTFVGAIPGAGGTPAALIAYQQARIFAKHPEQFGKGSPEGLAANEAAQNAANSGDAAPTFALGLPGSGSMVLLLSALTVHGFVPGPSMIRNSPTLFYAAISGMLAATIFLSLTGWKMAMVMLRIININRAMVIILAITTVLVGVYSLNTRMFDVYVVLSCGVVGYFMLCFGYSTAAAALACVMGGELERSLRLGLNLTHGDFIAFFSRPYTAFFVLLSISFLAIGIYQQVREKRRLRAEQLEMATTK